MALREYADLSALLLIILTVYVIDGFSGWLRMKIIGRNEAAR